MRQKAKWTAKTRGSSFPNRLSYLADFSVTGRLTGRLDQPAECFAETLRKRQGDLPSALQMTGWSEVMTMLSPISSASEVPAALM